jgi:hypothetical protein
MEILEKLKSLEPERRRSIIKILLDQAKRLQLKPEVDLLTEWYNEDPFESSSPPARINLLHPYAPPAKTED